jgi:GR25 family glycosyltransferase involved in LPS biosynthesis
VTHTSRQDDLNTWFAHKVCLNLDRRPERWSRMQERFARHGISDVVRFSAVDGQRIDVPPVWKGTAGAYGCLKSNLAVVTQARDNGWPSVLLFEDDVVFDEEVATKLPRFMAQLPSDWDMVFLGGMHRDQPLRVGENVMKLTATTSTYAYAVRSTLYDAFLETHADSREPIDVRNRVLQERFNCYCFFPHLAWVDGGVSDTQGRPVEPWWLKESLVLGGPTLDRIQKSTLVVVIHPPSAFETTANRNLIYTLDSYHRLLNGATVVVVEHHHQVNEAISQFGADKNFYLVADRDIVPSWDAKAHLLKCLEHDVASSFRRVIDLSPEDSGRLINVEPIDGGSYVARLRRGLCAESCIFTRDAFEKTGGWDGDEDRRSHNASRMLSVFDSPALGLRLFCNRSRAASEGVA